jgi:hypothetical protein
VFHWTRTTGLENLQDSILFGTATALVPITTAAWKTAQHFSYGARGFMRVPVSEANDLNFLLCRCHETSYASRLGNNEIEPMQRIDLNSAMKNRAPNNPIKPNLLEQRRTRRWC